MQRLAVGCLLIVHEHILIMLSPDTVAQVSVLVGLIYIALGALRLGFLTNFLSHSVISGFTTGAAVVIGVSQVCFITQGLAPAPCHHMPAGLRPQLAGSQLAQASCRAAPPAAEVKPAHCCGAAAVSHRSRGTRV